MEDVRRLTLRHNLCDALAIPQITLREPDVRQRWKRNRVSREIGSGYLPTSIMQKLHHMRADKSFGARYQRVHCHWNLEPLSSVIYDRKQIRDLRLLGADGP